MSDFYAEFKIEPSSLVQRAWPAEMKLQLWKIFGENIFTPLTRSSVVLDCWQMDFPPSGEKLHLKHLDYSSFCSDVFEVYQDVLVRI